MKSIKFTSIFLPVLTFVVFFQYALYNTPYQKYLVIWDEVLILIFALLVFSQKMLSGGIFKKSPFDRYILVLFLIMVFSMVLNNSPVLVGLYEIRYFFQYILLFYCIVNIPVSEKNILSVIKTIILCFLLQLPLLVYQIIDTITKGKQVGVDTLYGTFPGSNSLSYGTLFPIFLYAGLKNLKFKNVTNKFIFYGLITVMILGQGRLAILLFLMILVYIFRKKFLYYPFSSGVRIGGILLIFFTGLLVYFKIMTGRMANLFKHYNLIYHFTKAEFQVSSGSQRYLYYPLTYKILKREGIENLLFGLGPGMYGSFAAFKYRVPYADYLSNVFRQQELGFDPYTSSQVIPIWGELGFVGLIVYFLLLFKISKFSLRYKNSDNFLIRSLSLGLIAGSFLMIIGSFFHQVFETQVLSYPYWLLTALLLKTIKK